MVAVRCFLSVLLIKWQCLFHVKGVLKGRRKMPADACLKRVKNKKTLLFAALLFMMMLQAFGIRAAAAGVRLSDNEMYLFTSGQGELELIGASSSDKVKWSVSGDKVLTIRKAANNRITFTAKEKGGKARIRARYRKKKYTCVVHVMKFTASNSTTLSTGGFTKLKFSGVRPKWKSSNKKIARVNKNGKVTAKKAGTCQIYARIGREVFTVAITVREPALTKTSINLDVRSFTYIGFNVYEKAEFTADDPSIVSFSKRTDSSVYVYARNEGSTTITGKLNGRAYTCRVTVTGNRSDLNNIAAGKANGLYTRINDGTSRRYSNSGVFIGNGKSFKEYFFVYNGKAYLPYELPKDVEIRLLKQQAVFAAFFNNYLEKCRSLISDRTIAGLIAISHFIHDQGWKYSLTVDSDPIFGMIYERTGKCYHYANTFQYLCYLADIDCAVVECSYDLNYVDHDVNAVFYQGYWYFIEPQDFRTVTIERLNVDYFKNASLSYVDPVLRTYINIQQNRCFSALPSMASIFRAPEADQPSELKRNMILAVKAA